MPAGALIGILSLIFGNLCRKIELLTQTVNRHTLTHLLPEQPARVWVLLDGIEVEIPFEQLRVGDLLVLTAGQPVPLDGMIVQGVATLDQHRLTGESQPMEKAVGDPVLAATLVLGGRLHVRVEKTGVKTAAARIGEILNRTVEYQEVRLADQFQSLEKTRLPMLAGSALGWLIGGPTTAVAMLGCNYLLSLVPLRLLTLLNGLKAGAERGILVKDGRALERLPGIIARDVRCAFRRWDEPGYRFGDLGFRCARAQTE